MSRPFFAARLEYLLNVKRNARARNRAWSEEVVPYTGYGSSKFIRVLARVLLTPDEATPSLDWWGDVGPLAQRGWRNFVNLPAVDATVTVRVGDEEYQVETNRNGHVDQRFPVRRLEPGWHSVEITSGSSTVTAPIIIIDPDQEYGLVSDIDDTIISTSLPRPMLAAWNTFVLQESARQAVPGMAEMYRALLADHPQAPVVYVSTGAWNTAPTLNRFLNHHGYPRGPLLLTDWGPTNSGWFRSGQEHKRTCLRDLAIDFPKIKWILIGDDGQHDPALYGEFAESHPDRVSVIGLRELTPGEQVLAHGTLGSLESGQTSNVAVPEVRAGDGHELLPLVQRELAHGARSV